MNYYLLIPLAISILLIIILYSQNKKKKELVEKLIFEKHDLETLRKEEIKDYFEEEWKQEKDKLDKEVANAKKQTEMAIAINNQIFQNQTLEAKSQVEQLQIKLKEKEKRYNEVNQDLDLYRAGKMKEIDSTAAEYEKRKRQAIEDMMEKELYSLTKEFNQQSNEYNEKIKQIKQQIEETQAELKEERSKRAAINEEIRRQREVEEQQDFYRIQFSDEDKNDVEILRSVAPRLRHPEAINKVIWNAYYQKPLAELRKRAGIESSGVYKITRIKTGEIYIGQAVNVSTRWAEHCKSALGVGTLASSQLHRAMASDGCENFIFELLEETPKDKLRERESYYIDFYDSKNYGLNSVSGDKR